MAKIKAVLFDLDGTLRDTRDAIYDAYQQTIKDYTGNDKERHEIKPHIHHHTVVQEAFASHVDADEFRSTYSGYVDQPVLDSPLYDGVKELLAAVRAAGYQLAVVTTASHENVIAYLEVVGINTAFDAIAGMGPGLQPKPAPDLVVRALTDLDCDPTEAIMIGDMNVDVQAAHAAGLQCIGITHGFADKTELEAAGADHIVDSLEAILPLLETL